jgi:6,7-dimethyl-8-ribityllumazine synthase
LIARECAQSGEYDAIICLGAVLQGETSHAQHISSAVCSALMHLMLETGKPIALGILTEATFEQGWNAQAARWATRAVKPRSAPSKWHTYYAR